MGIVVFICKRKVAAIVSAFKKWILYSSYYDLVELEARLFLSLSLFLPHGLSAATCPTSLVPSAGRTGPKTVFGGPRMAVWLANAN